MSETLYSSISFRILQTDASKQTEKELRQHRQNQH